MSTGSRGRKLKIVCATEASYGAGTTNGFGDAGDTSLANHGLKAVSSPNPIDARQNFIDFIEHGEGYDEGDTVSGIRTVPFAFNLNFQGGGAATTPPRFGPLLRAAGMNQAIGASSVTYAPVGDADTPASAVIGVELDNSWVWEVRGCYVNIIMRLTPRSGWQMEVRGEGKWVSGYPTAGTFTTVYKAGWSGGTSLANKVALAGNDRFKINNGGSDYYPVWKSLAIDLGWRWIQDESMNDPTLLDCLLPDSPRQMRATVEIGMDNNASAGVPYDELFEDADDGTEHDLEFVWGDRGGVVEWTTSMTGRINQAVRHTGDSRRMNTINYKLPSSAALSMVQAAAA